MFKLTPSSVPVVAVLCLMLSLTACDSTPPRLKGESPQAMLDEAKALQSSGSWEQAIKGFEQLEATFPYGRQAQQAQLEIAYTYYRMHESASAIAACDRFIKQYPQHPNVDYAYYLKALSTLMPEDEILNFVYQRDMANLDLAATREAFDIFKQLVQNYPNSIYAPDSRQRMINIADALARGELNIARYYLRRGAPLAAANRAKDLLRNHPDSRVIEETLALMAASYKQMGLESLRVDAERVLRQNYPNSAWLSRDYVPPER
ncbi:outer membrane protein assembly factor BamD [Uliginosibacterium sediminicola]|uniref:Outer membrane protein assembly factor BamD n=1 Tax=Uliginosibacterium sediminicola TaxID=2024550 RepID=A0ABU9Z1U1_9RHOO